MLEIGGVAGDGMRPILDAEARLSENGRLKSRN
jgi:hypothetical protein